MSCITPQMANALRLILLTAQRPGEVKAMRFDEIDIDAATWTIPSDKTKTRAGDHVVPLSSWAIEIIKLMKQEGHQYVFTSDTATGHVVNITKARLRLSKVSGVAGWTSHDLRRTARTILSKVGVQPFVAERILNHNMAGMVAVYDQHDFLAEKREAIDRLEQHILHLIE